MNNTTTQTTRTTEFEGDPFLQELYLLLRRANNARKDATECVALHELSSKAEALAKRRESQS